MPHDPYRDLARELALQRASPARVFEEIARLERLMRHRRGLAKWRWLKRKQYRERKEGKG